MEGHVAMQRVMRHLPQYVFYQKPSTYKGCHQFVKWCDMQSDKLKERLRHIFTCLKVEDLARENTQLSDALRTRHERKQAKCRRKTQRARKRCGFRVPADHVVHHVDHDACNNRCTNLRVLSNQQHRTLHGRLHGNFKPRMCQELCAEMYGVLKKYYW